MAVPHPWKHSWADAYAARNDLVASEFLELVVRPSITALTQKHQEYVSSDDPVLYGFAAMDQLDLINKTVSAFCLSIQALWERQLRTYLTNCVKSVPIADIDPHRLESAQWGQRLDNLFIDVRGIELKSFESYAMLDLLHLLANACRHGEGRSSRELFARHPNLWPAGESPAAAFQSLPITEELLEGFVNAIVLFWMDMERLGLESFTGAKPTDRIAFLMGHRQEYLYSINRLLTQAAPSTSG